MSKETRTNMGWAKALYIDSLYAQAEQERRKAGSAEGAQLCCMAVNSGSLMLKRCRQAQTMHGYDFALAPPTFPVRMGKKVRTAVQDGFDSRARSSGLGSSDDGNNTPAREGQENNTGTNGQCEK